MKPHEEAVLAKVRERLEKGAAEHGSLAEKSYDHDGEATEELLDAIVYLADKLVRGAAKEPMEDRFTTLYSRYNQKVVATHHDSGWELGVSPAGPTLWLRGSDALGNGTWVSLGRLYDLYKQAQRGG